MSLDVQQIEPTQFHKILQLCTRVKSLTINCFQIRHQIGKTPTSWDLQKRAHSPISTYALEHLSISRSSDASLWGFLSRSPNLETLCLFPPVRSQRPSTYQWARLQEITEIMEAGMLSNLRQVHLSISHQRSAEDNDLKMSNNLCRLLNSMNELRCLKTFQSSDNIALSAADFKHQYLTLTNISVTSGTPLFWEKILSSCPNLLKAKQVNISAASLESGKQWLSTKLETLALLLTDIDKSSTDLQVANKNIFDRIAKLNKLQHLSLHGQWSNTSPHKKNIAPLINQHWQTLSRIKTLKTLELGSTYLNKLDNSSVLGLTTLTGLKEFRGTWIPSKSEEHLVERINKLGIAIVAGCPRYRFQYPHQ